MKNSHLDLKYLLLQEMSTVIILRISGTREAGQKESKQDCGIWSSSVSFQTASEPRLVVLAFIISIFLSHSDTRAIAKNYLWLVQF